MWKIKKIIAILLSVIFLILPSICFSYDHIIANTIFTPNISKNKININTKNHELNRDIIGYFEDMKKNISLIINDQTGISDKLMKKNAINLNNQINGAIFNIDNDGNVKQSIKYFKIIDRKYSQLVSDFKLNYSIVVKYSK